MRATLVERSAVRAIVRLTPSWLGRLFGAREVQVELVRSGQDWHTAATGEHVQYMRYGTLIRRALVFVPVEPLPRAEVRR